MKTSLADFPSCDECVHFTIRSDPPQGSCTLRKPLRDLECLAIKWKEAFEASLRSQIDENKKNIIGMDVESGVATGRVEVIEEILGEG